MSSESQPITPARFAAALPDLSVESLHSKATEIRNSIAHLKSSNEQLREFAVQGDKDCYEAMIENEEVIERMEHRIELLQAEVESRGLRWIDEHEKAPDSDANGERDTHDAAEDDSEEPNATGRTNATADSSAPQSGNSSTQSGRLTDEDLRRLLADRMGNQDDAEDGVHL